MNIEKNDLLKIHNVTKLFGTYTALKHVSLMLQEGEVLSLLGVNGAGKTTLSALIAGVHPPTEGEILWHERSIANDLIAYRAFVGYCPQRTDGDRIFTVHQHLEIAGLSFNLSKDIFKIQYDRVIDFCGLKDVIHRYPGELSGGYRQRFAIARAMLHAPKLLILDEPTVALDVHIRHQIWQVIRMLKSEGVTVVLTTHYLEEAEELSDRVCILEKGSIRLIDTPASLRASAGNLRLEEIFLKLIESE